MDIGVHLAMLLTEDHTTSRITIRFTLRVSVIPVVWVEGPIPPVSFGSMIFFEEVDSLWPRSMVFKPAFCFRPQRTVHDSEKSIDYKIERVRSIPACLLRIKSCGATRCSLAIVLAW